MFQLVTPQGDVYAASACVDIIMAVHEDGRKWLIICAVVSCASFSALPDASRANSESSMPPLTDVEPYVTF